MECIHENKEHRGKQVWCLDCKTLLDSGPVFIEVPPITFAIQAGPPPPAEGEK